MRCQQRRCTPTSPVSRCPVDRTRSAVIRRQQPRTVQAREAAAGTGGTAAAAGEAAAAAAAAPAPAAGADDAGLVRGRCWPSPVMEARGHTGYLTFARKFVAAAVPLSDYRDEDDADEDGEEQEPAAAGDDG